MENTNIDRELGWEDEIEKDGGEFILLPEGDYDFVVESFDRAHYQGGAKLPACNMAVLNIRIETPEGNVVIPHRLYLHTKTEGLISAFFSSIGLKEKGQKVKMNWTAVPGSTGRCKIGIHEWTNDAGEKRQSNDIKRFYPKEQRAYKAGDF